MCKFVRQSVEPATFCIISMQYYNSTQDVGVVESCCGKQYCRDVSQSLAQTLAHHAIHGVTREPFSNQILMVTLTVNAGHQTSYRKQAKSL